MKKLRPEAEKILRKAVQEYENEQIGTLSDAPVEAHRFSSRFEKNIEKIKFKDRSFKSALRMTYRVSMGIAAVLLIIYLVSPVKYLIFPNYPSEEGNTYWRGGDPDTEYSSNATPSGNSASGSAGNSGESDSIKNSENYNNNSEISEDVDDINTGADGAIDSDSDTVTDSAGAGEATVPSGSFEYLGDFDYVTEKKNGKSFQTDGFVNIEATSPESAGDVFLLAKKEYTGNFDFAQIYHDDENRMWKVSFVREKQTIRQIYIRDTGITVLIVK